MEGGLLEVFLESDEEITKVCCFCVACWKRNIFLEDDFPSFSVDRRAAVIGADVESDIPLFCVEEFFFCVDVNSSIQINAKAAYF